MPPDRRGFLRALVGAAVGAAAWPAAAAGCAPEAGDDGPEDAGPGDGDRAAAASRSASPEAGAPAGAAGPIGPPGLQLYTVRQEMARDFEGTLARVAEIGYEEVEFAGYFDRKPEEVRRALERAGLRAPAAHVSVDLAREDWPRTLEAAAAIGHEWLVVGSIPSGERTPDGYRAAAELFDRAGEAAREAGLRFGYHNHAFEFDPAVELPGRVLPLDFLLQATDAGRVDFEMDLYWTVRGGGDPLAYFDRFPGRFPLLHVKDSAGPPEHRMVDPGAGVIDFPAIFAARRRAGTRHFFAEHDEPEDPWATARAGYEYLAALRA